jgi:hypothetical protein
MDWSDGGELLDDIERWCYRHSVVWAARVIVIVITPAYYRTSSSIYTYGRLRSVLANTPHFS